MLALYKHTNILLVSISKTIVNHIDETLQKEGFPSTISVNTIRQAKRVLIELDIDLVMIDIHLMDEDGLQFAINLARNESIDYSIILLTKANQYEQNIYQTEKMGIVSLKQPLDMFLLLQTIHLLFSFRIKIKKLEKKADTLQKKLQNDRLVNRAKLLLVAQLQMSEQDAHYYIEKVAMDRCVKKTVVARDIINMYE